MDALPELAAVKYTVAVVVPFPGVIVAGEKVPPVEDGVIITSPVKVVPVADVSVRATGTPAFPVEGPVAVKLVLPSHVV